MKIKPKIEIKNPALKVQCFDLSRNISIIFLISSIIFYAVFKLFANVPALGEVANFGTNYFLLNYKFLAKCKREFTTKFAILPNAC